MGNKHSTLKSLFDDIADSIRNKTGSTGDIIADDFPEAIDGIRTSDIQLAEIAVTKQPTKTSYTAKETFNRAGMEVKAVFSNDASKFVTDFNVEPSGALKPTDTKVKIKYTEFGVTAEADVAVTVAAIKLNVPTASGTPVYTSSAITPAWSGYDSSLMAISGDTSGINAGSYTAVFSLKDKVNYTWADGTTEDKSVTWSIGKAQASITLDKSSVVLNGDTLTETVNISSVGMTSIMVMSSDMTVAMASLNGNVLTISSVDETTGTATIVINGTVDSNYNAPEYPSVAVTAEFAQPVTITIVAYGISPNGNANVTLNGQTYSAKGMSISADQNNPTPIAEVTVSSGTVMSCSALVPVGTTKGYIRLNGTTVVEAASGVPATYDYVVNGNIKVALNDAFMAAANLYTSLVHITETPVTFTINGTEYSAYPSMTWNDWNDSDFNISGQKVATVTDASGNSVSLDSLIVGGGVYIAEFAPTIGTCYLRPSADVNVNNTSTYAYPSGSAFYQCIDEEVADGDSTYIYTTGGYPQTIQFYGTLPANATITEAKYIVVMKRTGEYDCVCNFGLTGSTAISANCANNAYTEYSVALGEDMVSILNTSNSDGSIAVDAMIVPAVSAPLEDKTGSTTLYVTQIYVELTYEA